MRETGYAHFIMDKHYDPKKIEKKWYDIWQKQGAFHSDAARGGEPYCTVIPPPNVTGILHMGHALNNTIQDILVRWQRMTGRNTVWLPGTDHAGIATQNVVERALMKENKSREDLGRDAFVERVWQWKKEYGDTIIRQLKWLGASCDWERERFTMDEGLSDAVAEVFVRLYEKGLIYRGNYIINWCSRCHTALSDEESEHADEDGKLYYIRYEVKPQDTGTSATAGAKYIVVATTRPETLLGDVAVAVNPNDERYGDLSGKTIVLPVLGRKLQVIQDDFVDPEFGTGVVKVTPAHDPNDFEMGMRHGLTPVNVMNGDGTMNDAAGPYAGLDRFECRRKILDDLKKADLVEKIENHKHAIGHCYRCDTIVEPRLSPQWFVKMKPLAAPAIEAVKNGKVVFIPGRWTKVYLEWMENIRDWCISRQIWWGHRIPVFYCDDCEHEWAARKDPGNCPECGSCDIRQDEDVLDTWFSSWLWPFSTFGWPGSNPDLSFYYPTSDLVTASEIIFFWVARMIMAGIEFMGDVPFRTVYIHGTVRDDDGLKMSKSLGNAIDPLTVIEEFSADALRFSLMMITATGQDIYVSNEKFEIGRNFGTKLWNAARFMQLNRTDGGAETVVDRNATLPAVDPSLLTPDDKHILASLHRTIAACNVSLKQCRFNDAAHALYDFMWHQLCDWYVEYSKPALYSEDKAEAERVLQVMHFVVERALRLLHPMMPFVTEELWHSMDYGSDDELIILAPWPEALDAEGLQKAGIDSASVDYVDRKHELIRCGRNLRSDYGIVQTKKVDYLIKPVSGEYESMLKDDIRSITALLRADNVTVDSGMCAARAMPSAVRELGTIYMPLEGLIDIEAEKGKLAGQLKKIEQDLRRVTGKLENEEFVGKAPPHVVQRQEEIKQDLINRREKLEHLAEMLTKA